MNAASRDLAGKTLLVVEDDYMVASELALTLAQHGAEVVGPVGRIQEALALIESNEGRIGGAVLDINLQGERTFSIADALNARQVPYVFVTGYDDWSIPKAYAQAPRFDKPVDPESLIRVLRSLE